MTPAEKPSEPARTLRDASFTTFGKNTTAAPRPVEAPAPATRANAMPTLSFPDVIFLYLNTSMVAVIAGLFDYELKM